MGSKFSFTCPLFDTCPPLSTTTTNNNTTTTTRPACRWVRHRTAALIFMLAQFYLWLNHISFYEGLVTSAGKGQARAPGGGGSAKSASLKAWSPPEARAQWCCGWVVVVRGRGVCLVCCAASNHRSCNAMLLLAGTAALCQRAGQWPPPLAPGGGTVERPLPLQQSAVRFRTSLPQLPVCDPCQTAILRRHRLSTQ